MIFSNFFDIVYFHPKRTSINTSIKIGFIYLFNLSNFVHYKKLSQQGALGSN
jgi:hypothetical protein